MIITEENKYPNNIPWGIYDPIGGNLIEFKMFLGEDLTFPPFNMLEIEIEEDWTPREFKNTLEFCESSYAEKTKSRILHIFTAGELELQRSRVLTYQLPNGEIYRWGPEPLSCPYFEITYP